MNLYDLEIVLVEAREAAHAVLHGHDIKPTELALNVTFDSTDGKFVALSCKVTSTELAAEEIS